MTTEHPITPPPELVDQWRDDWLEQPDRRGLRVGDYIAAQAARWGADQELEACCEWLDWQKLAKHENLIAYLRAARRPKPPTLNSIALQMLGTIERDGRYLPEITDTIRRALEQLP
jgi:hypothetical protein